MVETATNKPSQILAKRQLDAIRNTRAVTSNQSKVLQMIQSTVENGGGTFKFMTGDVPQGGVAVAVRGFDGHFGHHPVRGLLVGVLG
jgi:hypothetical protein